MAGCGGAMADIFISYARTDVETARTLAEALETQGWSVWWDRRIPAGRRFDEVIDAQLSAARCVISLWSEAGVASHWVREEAADARERGILTPAFLEPVRAPLGFRSLQSADLNGWRGDRSHGGFQQLVEDIEALLGAPGAREPASEPVPEPSKPSPSRAAKKSSAPEDLPDFSVFRDIDEPWCPEMVVLPAGDFMMGSPDTDKDAQDYEKPRHKVTIGYRFAVGRYPVTFEEYDRFCETAGVKQWVKQPGDQGWGRGRRPVINVSRDDAKAYVDWLSKQTGKSYRLLSEAQWEYACRAGAATRYSSGDCITEKDANCNDNVGKTTEVGSYNPNPWGLFDMHGNVWEWVEDVGHDTYEGAPDDGGAWTKGGDRNRRVLRGGSWDFDSRYLRSADRSGYNSDLRSYCIGLRLARTF